MVVFEQIGMCVVDQKDKEEAGELVIATTTTPILAGTLAGLVAPKWSATETA